MALPARMGLMEVTKVPHQLLTQKTKSVSLGDIRNSVYAKFLTDMRAAMKEHHGIGLAANQLGKNISIFVIDAALAQENDVPDAYFNPEITEHSKDQDELEEGCLSIPQFYVPVKRAKKIKFKAYNEKGERVKFRARGLLARVLQHETDHLNGIMIKSRVSR